MIISTTDYDPTNEISIDSVGQNYILSLYSLNSDFIGDAFLCRSAVIKNTVYVKIFNAQSCEVFNSETKTIAITDNKCVYDVTVNNIPYSKTNFCSEAKFYVKLTDFVPLPNTLVAKCKIRKIWNSIIKTTKLLFTIYY
jgi:hypothetical protein